MTSTPVDARSRMSIDGELFTYESGAFPGIHYITEQRVITAPEIKNQSIPSLKQAEENVRFNNNIPQKSSSAKHTGIRKFNMPFYFRTKSRK